MSTVQVFKDMQDIEDIQAMIAPIYRHYGRDKLMVSIDCILDNRRRNKINNIKGNMKEEIKIREQIVKTRKLLIPGSTTLEALKHMLKLIETIFNYIEDKMHKKDKTEKKVSKVMNEFKEGKLHSGSKKGPVVKNPKQAIAIGLSEARKVTAKLPKKGK